MTLVFKTPEDSPRDVEISGVGVLHAGAADSVTIDHAAQFLVELQARDDLGRVEGADPVSGYGKPLTGKKLEAAAQEFAQGRGLEVVNLSETKLDKEPVIGGSPLDDLPDILEVAKNTYQETFGEEAPPLETAVEAAAEADAEAVEEASK